MRAERLTLTYTTPRSVTHAVREVSMGIGSHTFAGIVGPSGSGKSSLLYLLSGLKSANSGEVHFGDFHYSAANPRQQLDFRRQNFGFVFQSPFLISYLSVLENVLVPIDKPSAEDKRRAYDLLCSLGIEELAPKFPNECSGGERVRVAMARGLISRPRWLWVDEPTASLDLATGNLVIEILRTQTEHGSLVVVTHDMEIVERADLVFRMRDGELVETQVRGSGD